MDELLKLLGASTPYLYAAGTYAFFRWLDNNASDEAKSAIGALVKITDYDQKLVAAALTEVFDRLYTRPLFGWRAFIRSTLISIVIMVIYFYETEVFDPRNYFAPVLLGIIGTNIFSDYLSLFLIRRWLLFSGNRPLSALIVGSMIGVAVVFAGMTIRYVSFLAYWAYSVGDDVSWDTIMFLGMFFSPAPIPLFGLPAAIVFAWLPLFAIGIFVLRLAKPIRWVITKAQWFLKGGKEHPLDAIGYIAALVVFVCSLAFQHFFKKGGS